MNCDLTFRRNAPNAKSLRVSRTRPRSCFREPGTCGLNNLSRFELITQFSGRVFALVQVQ